MKKVPSLTVKQRSRELTSVFESFTPYDGMEGRVERIWITEIATDGVHLVRLFEQIGIRYSDAFEFLINPCHYFPWC